MFLNDKTENFLRGATSDPVAVSNSDISPVGSRGSHVLSGS